MSRLAIFLLGVLYIHTTTGQAIVLDFCGPQTPVTEGVPYNICVTISASPAQSITVNLRSNSPALETLDMNITFSPSGPTQFRIQTMSLNDRVYTSNNFIDIPPYVLSGPLPSTVPSLLINNEAAIPVGFQQSRYLFLEGTTNSVCVDVEDSWRILNTLPARLNLLFPSSEDYTVSLNGIEFQAGSTSACINVVTNSDTLVEGVDTFNITLEVPTNIYRAGAIVTAVVSIIDEDASCGNPPQLAGFGVTAVSGPAVLNSSGNYVTNAGAMAQYECQPSELFSGSSVLTCTENMTSGAFEWVTSQLLQCRLLRCGNLTSPTNGTVQFSNDTVGSIAIYTCEDGFLLSQDINRTCLRTEMWSGEEPECDEIIFPPTGGEIASTNNRRRLAIGLGVGIGGAVLLLVLLLLIICCCVCCCKRRQKTHSSKYVLNYDTVYAGSAAKSDRGNRDNIHSELPQHI